MKDFCRFVAWVLTGTAGVGGSSAGGAAGHA